ncbi:glycogen synthase [Bifidobacterium choloepi]|uniref:Glycogen synthase n=1 Tax=Bifidobacterium choloepi TaxID=2614131 RepID=A0A6I5NJZ8_9BIFI|nr:glycogen synthase [Bifidobacterium choloepi]NEG69182.1 glycogen synthase [Bifidobacterium choloepi]
MRKDSGTPRIDFLTREYPPTIYGGAGVHAEELSKALAERIDVTVRAFDGPRLAVDIPQIPAEDPAGSLRVVGYDVPEDFADDNTATKTFAVDLQMADDVDGDLVHAHTWYTCLAGRLAQQLHDVPLVVTAHSIEPQRPWKRDQLGGGYELSMWAEREAFEHADRIIAVSDVMRRGILEAYPAVDPERVVVIHNGITISDFTTPDDDDPGWDVFDRHDIDRDMPTVLYVGRMSRQKGLPYLLAALRSVSSGVQVVLCGAAPDAPEAARDVRESIKLLQKERGNVVWIDEVPPTDELNALEHGCDVFVAPSLYEPLAVGVLEAMACGLPVVATQVGSIPEIVVDGETGFVVPIGQRLDGSCEPADADTFVTDLATAINRMVENPARAEAMGIAGYQRARDHFSWERIADQTIQVYEEVIAEHRGL